MEKGGLVKRGATGLQALAVRYWHPATRLGWVPNVTSPWSAIARLHLLVWWRRQRTAALTSCGVQVAATGLAALGAYHVAELEPAAAWPLLRTLAIVGGFASAWSLARASQALDRERWFLDTLGITAASVLRGRLAAGLAVSQSLARASRGPCSAHWEPCTAVTLR